MHEEAELVGYLLGALDPEDAERVEQRVAEDPAARAKLERISRALWPVGPAAQDVAPPPGLADRAVRLVQRHRHAEPWVTGTAGTWRLSDLAIAASILVIFSSVIFPAITQSRRQSALAQCSNNLRTIAVAMESYAQHHNQYLPFAPARGSRTGTNMSAALLVDAGFVSDPSVFLCPGVAHDGFTIPRSSPLRGVADDVSRIAPVLGDYAFSLGVNVFGQYRAPRIREAPGGLVAADLPAARPNGDCAIGNSANHGGCGQNLAFADGHVAFSNSPDAGPDRDNIYENQNHFIGPGLNWNDPVLSLRSNEPGED
jgi:prepilin-type processing-associated H-X9-DG protein